MCHWSGRSTTPDGARRGPGAGRRDERPRPGRRGDRPSCDEAPDRR
ncbi:hypothetical protein Ae168Ps1_2388c [Pseudonocardia sp. Ae168_Ps1]|nr:hypothetical protein Ae150APs1_2384c [Pseudonocardia sp. Ae150A_Ps1]OLL79982.1 hypothetical protein Ae168Ps1_2388c [Pseudonocardia sp. Ae168_Ps1]OLL85884.1 hypothetical protein Ae263Ps1_2939 [Pseudonocardia sp. Ae263_Ps1]OLL94085.1 hypothetical protein Ae356Ps1_3982c [Pseudonocardia sp. Ae356_Ps1]